MQGKITFIVSILLLCIALQAQTVEYNQEFQVNTYTKNDQKDPTVCGLSDGGFMVCWTSYGQDGDEWGIFGQIYDSSGTKLGQEFQINTYTNRYQYGPTVCGLSDGGFLVCWESYGQDGEGYGIFGQIYNNNGTKRGQEFQVNTYTASFQTDPCVSGLADGGFIVCWESYQDGYLSGVFGQIYDNDGTKRGQEFQVNTYTNSDQEEPTVCGLSDGGFVVCWQSRYQDGGMSGIFGQIYDNDGTKRGEEFQINTYTSSYQRYPTVCGLPDGGFMVVWESAYQDGDAWGIFGQLYDSSGTKRRGEFRINTYTKYSQYQPSTSQLSDSSFVVCWQSYDQDGDSFGIFGKYYIGSPILHSLQSFSIISPAYDATLYSTNVNFQWQQASPIHLNFPWELEYYFYLDQTEDFDNPQIFSNIYDTTFTIKSLTPSQTYFWKVMAKNIDGDSLWSSETFGFYVSPAAGIEDDVEIKPGAFKLYANYPNPFNPETTVRYNLPADQSSYRVIIKIYDVLGQLVITLRDAQQRPGLYRLTWDGRNSAGQAVPSGVYFCVLDAGSFKATQKMLLVR